MALSTDLAKKFAKIANKNNKETTKKEKIAYGHITQYKTENGKQKWYVHIDGAPEGSETPVSHFTSTVNRDERVILMIKDHSVVVTGNIETPATTQSYVDSKDFIFKQVVIQTESGPKPINYKIGLDKDGNMIYEVVDYTGAEVSTQGPVTKTYGIATTDMVGGNTSSVDLADIRALWPDCNYE